MKKIIGIIIFLNCAVLNGQIDAVVKGPDTLFIGQNAEYFAEILQYPNRFFFNDTSECGSLKADYSSDVITNNFTYDLRVKPDRLITIKDETSYLSGDERFSLANTDQNWAIVPLNSEPGYGNIGLTVGTNGIMVGERSGSILVSVLSYETAIPDWVHVTVVCRPDTILLYLDGLLVKSSGINGSEVRTISDELAGSSYSQGFTGGIDEYRLWDIALSQEEIKEIKDKKLLGHISGLRYYASFDRGKFERTFGDIGDQYMSVTGFSGSDHLKYSSWDLDSYSGSGIFNLNLFDIHNINYVWSTGSTNRSIAFSPIEGENPIFVKIYCPVPTKNTLFEIIDSITVTGIISAITPEEGLVAYYPFNGTAKDESVFRNDGLMDGPQPATDLHGVANMALLFDGENDVIKINGALPVANVLSVSFLALSQNDTGYGDILSDGGSSAAGNNFLIDFQGNNIGIRADKDAILNYEDSSPPELQDLDLVNKWVHVVWVMTPDYSKVYLDGVLKTTIYEAGSNLGHHDDFSYIGARQILASPENYFKGKLDELKIYNRELSDQEIETLYNSYNFQTAEQPAIGDGSTINETDNSKIQVYPNPATNYVVVETTDFSEFQGDLVRIVNLSGHTVYSTTLPGYTNQINLPEFQGQGMFILQIYSPTGVVKSTKKVIFQ